MLMNDLKKSDPEVFDLIAAEGDRIEKGVELIPSENFVSKAVMQAMSSVFTNKYSEGYPGRRYYGGQEFVDKVERLAIRRAKELFGAEHVNVQPYSGSPANHAVFFALLELGDKFMGLEMGCGGHLTHGSPVNFSGLSYTPILYYVDRETELIDLDEIRRAAIKERPKMIISSLTAYPRKLDFKGFQEICEEVDAYHLADISHIAGLIVGGVHESPFPFTDVVTTTTHKSLRGPRGAMIMCRKEDRLHDLYHPDTKKNLRRLIDSAVFPGLQGGPHDHITAAKAVAFSEANRPEFKTYAGQIVKNAKAMADELMAQGIKLVSDGTDNHLMVIDMRPSGLTGKGKQLQSAMDEAGITLNKNSVPFDEARPFNPSGLRLGTPAVTTRGMGEDEMRVIARCIARVIGDYRDKPALEKTRQEILELVSDFPLYPDFTVLE
jgi:glycine hydroxymethyltransferase